MSHLSFDSLCSSSDQNTFGGSPHFGARLCVLLHAQAGFLFFAMSIELMSRVWKETAFKGTELLVLLCLADHANDEGICWPAYKTIAARARTSPRWAMRCVKNLEAQGFLERDRGNVGRSNTYTLKFPPAAQGGEDNSPPVSRRGVKPSSPTREAQFTPGVLLNSTGGVKPSSHESSDEPSENRHGIAARCADGPSFESIFEHILSTTTTNQIMAVALAERWQAGEGHSAGENWKPKLTAWLKNAA
jgi:hypothetical protein